MTNSKLVFIVSVIITMGFVSFAFAEGVVPSDDRKKTSAGKYVTALQAFEMWKAAPEEVFIIDVRTPEEYVYIGHPRMAINIPWQVWTGKYDPEKKDVVLDKNPDFVTEIQKRYKPEDTLLIMCRSGHRSAPSCEAIIKTGFENVYHVIDGFEGDKVSDPENSFNGMRMKNGWRNSGLPWTYDTDMNLIPSLIKKVNVSDEVQRLCREGDAVSGFNMAMTSLLHAQRKFGKDDPRTAGCMVTVANAAQNREKYHLAGVMYRRALSIVERAFGPTHPDVVHCKTVLSRLEQDHGQ